HCLRQWGRRVLCHAHALDAECPADAGRVDAVFRRQHGDQQQEARRRQRPRRGKEERAPARRREGRLTWVFGHFYTSPATRPANWYPTRVNPPAMSAALAPSATDP